MIATIRKRMQRKGRFIILMTPLASGCLILLLISGSLIHASEQELEKLNRFVQASNSSSAAMKAFREGRDLIGKEEWAEAADKFNQVVTQYSNSEVTDVALYWLAFALKKQNKFQEADNTLERLIIEYPRSNWINDAKAMKAETAPHLSAAESLTEEIQRVYKLAPGARVEVSNINGPVEIETTDSDTAEVHIIRSGRTQADLSNHKIIIEQTPSSLVVRGEPELDWLRRGSPAPDFLVRLSRDPSGFDWLRYGREVVMLKLPREVELVARHINSHIKVGKIKGSIQLSGVNGRVEVADVEGSAEASGINGGLSITIARLGERGIGVKDINGGAELSFLDVVHADLDVKAVGGSVYVDVPNVTAQNTNNDVISHARIGSGGPPITISGVNGSVRIRHANGESSQSTPTALVLGARQQNPSNTKTADKPEELQGVYKLAPGARVEVSNINGPVEIETANTDTAEVRIISFGQDRAGENDSKISIVDTPTSLTIRATGSSLRSGRNEVRHRVMLKIPRKVDLTINHTSDQVTVGEIDGSIHLNGLSWKADMALAVGEIEISRISGTAVVRIAKLSERGASISNVSGKVELLLPADLNANIDVSRNHGRVVIEFPHKVKEGTLNGPMFRTQVGSGGPQISIFDIIGAVTLRRL